MPRIGIRQREGIWGSVQYGFSRRGKKSGCGEIKERKTPLLKMDESKGDWELDGNLGEEMNFFLTTD